eukprot:scaffold72875_cov21-Prasinocladus_malaysianus.AAC.1
MQDEQIPVTERLRLKHIQPSHEWNEYNTNTNRDTIPICQTTEINTVSHPCAERILGWRTSVLPVLVC